MCISVRDSDGDEWRPYSGMAFTRMGGSYAEASATVTDEDGCFIIHQNETVTFPEVGRATDNPHIQYKIFEFKDDKYGQIYPPVENADGIAVGEPQTPIIGTMHGEEVSTMIVNGEEGVLILDKEYIAANTAGASLAEKSIAQDYLENLRTIDSARQAERLKLTLEVEYEQGEGTVWERWPAQTAEVMTIDLLDDNLGVSYTDEYDEEQVYGVTDIEWQMGTTMYVEPWTQIVINDLEEGLDPTKTWTGRYRVYEDVRDRHKLYTTDEKRIDPNGGFIEINAQTARITDSRESRPVAVLTNEIKGIVPKSVIRKRMLSGSSEITENSALVFKLEVPNGSAWVPAEGIPYMIGTFDARSAEDGAHESGVHYLDDTVLSDGYQYTNADGRIVVQKKNLRNAENGKYIFPRIIFPENSVKPSYDNPSAGDLRISEVLEDAYSSEEWGRFIRLESDEASSQNNHISTYTFVNGNREAKIEVKKLIVNEEHPDMGAVFSFEVRQLTSDADEENITASSGIIARRVPYNIYELDSFGNEVKVNSSTLYTGNDGIIRLKHGQTARLDVVDETRWTVHEIVASGYTLNDMYIDGFAVNGEKLGDNLAVLQANAAVLPDRLEAISQMPCFGVYDVISPEDLLGTVVYTNGARADVPKGELIITGAKLVRKISGEETDYSNGTIENRYGTLQIKPGTENVKNIEVRDGKVYVMGGAQGVVSNGIVKISAEYTVNGTKLTSTVEKPLARSASLGPHSSYNPAFDDSYKAISCAALNYNDAPLYEVTGEGISETPIRWSGQNYIPNGKVIEDGDLIIPPYIADEAGNYYVVRKIGSWKNDTYQGGFFGVMKSESGRIVLPDTLMAIERQAFSRCAFSGEIKFPPLLRLIGSSAFDFTAGDYTVVFNDGLEEICNQAFQNAMGLKGDIILPDSLKKISGRENFRYTIGGSTSGLTGRLRLPENEEFTQIPASAFYNCRFTGTIDIPEQITYIGGNAFCNCKFTGELVIPENVTYLGGSAFENNKLSSLVFNTDYLSYMGRRTFAENRSLNCDIVLPKRIDDMDINYGGENFRNIGGGTITFWTEGFNEIASSMFSGTNLTGDLTIPEVIEVFHGIRGSSFNGTLTVDCDPNLIGSEYFSNGNFTAVVIGANCPAGKEHTVTLSRYANDSVRGFADSSKNTYNNVRTLTLGKKVGNIEGDSLKGLKNLTTVYADTSLQGRIPDGAFYNRSNITIIYQDIP